MEGLGSRSSTLVWARYHLLSTPSFFLARGHELASGRWGAVGSAFCREAAFATGYFRTPVIKTMAQTSQRPDPPRPSRDDASTFWRVARPIRPMMGASGTALRRSERPALVQESGQPLGPGGPPALRAWMEWPESGRFLAGAGAHGPLLYSRARAGRWELASDRLQGQGRRVECPGRPARSTSGGSGRFGPLWWT